MPAEDSSSFDGDDGRRPAQPQRTGGSGRRWLKAAPRLPAPGESPYDPGALTSRTGVLRRRQYSVSTLSVLTRRYVKVRGDLLVSVGDGSDLDERRQRYARRCSEYLCDARKQLESRRANFFVCSSLLFLADVTLVWLYPKGILELRSEAVQDRLARMGPEVAWRAKALRAATNRADDDRFLRSALEDALTYLQQSEQDAAIADDLQVTRLRMLIGYIAGALLLLMAAVPYVTLDLSQTSLEGWPVVQFPSRVVTHWVSAAAVCAIGAVGGIFSGLLATRDATTSLLDYRASVLKLALKPLVGAVAALTLYLLLSWQILTGVEVTSGGTFLLVGFLAGFSERYFLRVLRAETPSEPTSGHATSSRTATGVEAPAPPAPSPLERSFDTEDPPPSVPAARQAPETGAAAPS